MQNINILQTKYSLSEAAYQLKLPIDLGIIIPENDCVRLLSQFVEGLDLTDLYSTYSRHRENQASPRQMLKILLYAYLEGIYASRGVEKACQKNVDFMYLLEGKPEAASGSVVACLMEGTRPILIEIQALVCKSNLAFPRRTAEMPMSCF